MWKKQKKKKRKKRKENVSNRTSLTSRYRHNITGTSAVEGREYSRASLSLSSSSTSSNLLGASPRFDR